MGHRQTAESAFEGEAWRNFIRGVTNKESRKVYTNAMQHYMRFLKIDSPQRLLEGEQQKLEDNIIGFINDQQDRDLSADIVKTRVSAIRKFYERNRKPLSWDYIRDSIAKTKKKTKDKAYSVEQIDRMLAVSDHREKALTLLLVSSGVREGAIPDLVFGNLHPIEKYGIYRITVYEGYGEEYTTYCTPECRKALEEYLDYRRRCGEEIKADSLVIRDYFNDDDHIRAKRPRNIGPKQIYNIMSELAIKAGIRTKIHLTEGMALGSVRHEIKAVHGCRKFFDTQATNAGMNLLWVEMLEGHDVKLKDSYYRPNDSVLLEGNKDMKGYVSVIDSLTINDIYRLKKEVAILNERQKDVPKLEALQSANISMQLNQEGLVKEVKETKEELASLKEFLKALKEGKLKDKPNAS